MVVIHQAVYGDKSGAYALLSTTLPDTNVAKRICNITDLVDRPSSGQLRQPIIRAFAINDHYIFIKSFPDNDPSVRKGRVLSHTLIAEKEDLDKIHNLGELFSHFLSEPKKILDLKPIDLNDKTNDNASVVSDNSREAAIVNFLLNHSSHKNTLVWVGEDGYLSAVAKIWGKLKGNLRIKIKLGIGFNPQKIDRQCINILYVGEEDEARWQVDDYCVINKEALSSLKSMSSFLLAGRTEESKRLADFIKAFGITPSELEDFKYLETCVSTYSELSSKTDFNQLIVLCDLISKYSPNQNTSKEEKNKLLKQVLLRIESASSKQLFVLQHTEWKGFLEAQKLIGEKISNRIVTSFPSWVGEQQEAKLINAALDPENRSEWWKKAITSSLKSTLEKWQKPYAKVLLGWFSEDPNLLKMLEQLIPSFQKTEGDFVSYWKAPSKRLVKSMEVFAKDRGWLIIHGLSLLQLYTPEEGIERQLKVDTDCDYDSALQKMSEFIQKKDFIQIAVKIGDVRLVKLAAKISAKKPSLFNALDVTDAVWRKIWLERIVQEGDIWGGVKKPCAILFELFEELINGEEIDHALLLELSNSKCNDLSDFERRKDVWQHLDEEAKFGFLDATTLGCLRLLNKKKIDMSDVEEEILSNITNPPILEKIMRDETIPISMKLLFFEGLPDIEEKDLLLFLETPKFSLYDSKLLGKIIFHRCWSRAAREIAGKIFVRKDLVPALKECVSLLNFFERMGLSYSGIMAVSISPEEWWGAFTEQCCKKYPRGPTQNGLWGRSGGEDCDLPTTGTGKEIWLDTLSRLQRGNIEIDIQSFIREMLKDYPLSEELKQLKETFSND